MAETFTSTAEVVSAPETTTSFEPLTGAQFRLILSNGYVDPTHEIPIEISPGEISDFEKRDYSFLADASEYDRQMYIQEAISKGEMPTDYDQQVIQWAEQTTQTLTSEKNQDKLAKLTPFLQHAGYSPDNLNPDEMKRFYTQFFGTEATDVKGFVSQILTTHTYEGKLDYDDLKEHLPEYGWFSRIFGTEMQEVVTQMIDAEALLMQENGAQLLIEKAQEVLPNGKTRSCYENLTEKEKKILEFLTIHKTGNVPQNASPSPSLSETKPIRFDRKKFTFPEEVQQINLAMTETILNSSPENIKAELPINNAEGAAIFCDTLRKRIMEHGSESPPFTSRNQTVKMFTDPITNISVRAADRENINDAWFSPHQFNMWSENHHLPMAYYIKPGHATLLLRDPYKDADGQWKMQVYDPIQGEQTIPFHVKQDIDMYREQQLKQYAQFYDKNSDLYIIPPPPEEDTPSSAPTGLKIKFIPTEQRLTPGQIDQRIYFSWLRDNDMADTIIPNGLAKLGTGTYDLTLPPEEGLPSEIISSKVGRQQFDSKNCAPITMFAAALRYAAKPGENNFKTKGRENFQRDFGIKILTREEILNATNKEVVHV